ncbi:MAG: cyclodeaminase/cyclohydrolase family protein [Bacteroidota bacterium]
MKDYLNLPAKELLDEYGTGSHVPGSGSAAAMGAMIGAQLAITVCKLTCQKPRYKDKHAQVEHLQKELEIIFNKLKGYFYRDIEIFSEVSKLRIQRDQTLIFEEKDKFQRAQLEQLKLASDIPLFIADEAFRLAEIGIILFDSGFKSARGDSGVAIANGIGAATGALFVILLNLKSFQESEWKDQMYITCNPRFLKLQTLQLEAMKRTALLKDEGDLNGQLEIAF